MKISNPVVTMGLLFGALMGILFKERKTMRTIKQFISKTNKVYFYFKDIELCKQFYQNAEAEGITFGGNNPTENKPTDIVALLPNGEICYVGWAGRMCYHNCKEGVVRIDYEKYVNNASDYIIRK